MVTVELSGALSHEYRGFIQCGPGYQECQSLMYASKSQREACSSASRSSKSGSLLRKPRKWSLLSPRSMHCQRNRCASALRPSASIICARACPLKRRWRARSPKMAAETYRTCRRGLPIGHKTMLLTHRTLRASTEAKAE
jgi:hypothetical protein